jgi:hypothetical protein
MMRQVALLQAKVEALEAAEYGNKQAPEDQKKPDSVKEEVLLYSRDKSYGSRENIGSWESKRRRKTGVNRRGLHQRNGDVAFAGSRHNSGTCE